MNKKEAAERIMALLKNASTELQEAISIDHTSKFWTVKAYAAFCEAFSELFIRYKLDLPEDEFPIDVISLERDVLFFETLCDRRNKIIDQINEFNDLMIGVTQLAEKERDEFLSDVDKCQDVKDKFFSLSEATQDCEKSKFLEDLWWTTMFYFQFMPYFLSEEELEAIDKKTFDPSSIGAKQ